MAYRADECLIIKNIVICDNCGFETLIKETKGVPLNFDNRMNGALTKGYTFKQEGQVFKNYCRKCRINH